MRVARPWLGGLALAFLALTTSAPAQTAPATKKDAPAPPPDTRPLARYAPAERLYLHAEILGLDSQTDAWKKTAAYKMLNETTLGAMLEDLATQLVERLMSKNPNANRVSGANLVAIAKHVARHGALLSCYGDDKNPDNANVVVVFRAGATKEMRAAFAQFLFSFAKAEGKARQIAQRGRTLIVMPGAVQKESWVWWTEQDDLVLVLEKSPTIDIVMDVLEGKRKSAVEHPIRAELVQPESGFTPVALAFFDAANVPAPPNPQLKTVLSRLKRLDYRWGIQENALMSITRIVAPKPRGGLLALLDQPSFDKKTVPAVLDGASSFTALSVEPARFVDTLVAVTKSYGENTAAAKFGASLEAVFIRGRINLRKDLLPYLGPRMVFYTAPGKPGEAAATSAGLGMAGLNPMAMLSGMAEVPKYTLIAEVNNPTAFAKGLDNLIIVLNQTLKSQASEAAGRVDEAARKNQRQGDGAPPAEDAPRSRGPAPAPEFRPTGTGKVKSYLLNVPAEMGKLPAGVKPTIRFEGKFLAISVSPNAAQQALEAANASAWTPPADMKETADHLPARMIALSIDDPRSTLPNLLATLPGTLQAAINQMILQAQGPAVPMANAGMPGGRPGGLQVPGTPNGPPGSAYPNSSSSGSSRGGSDVPPPGYSQPGSPVPGAPPGTPGAEGAEGTIQIQIDPAKMPAASALKPYLFPGSFAVISDDQSVQFVNREAFPNVANMRTNSILVALFLPAVQAARNAARRAQGGAAGGAAPAGAAAPAPAPAPAPVPSQSPATPRDPRGSVPR
jgi:hypothetical protein